MGKGRFIDDVRLPEMAHAYFVRSPFAHARIASIGVEDAQNQPGVIKILTGADIAATTMRMVVPGPPNYRSVSFHPLATDRVRFVGDPVAIVLASSRALAEDAGELVDVDYELLPAVTSVAGALAPAATVLFEELGDNVIFQDHACYGDPDAAFERADRVIQATISQHRHAHVPMEGRGAVADFNQETAELTFYGAHQAPQMVRFGLANLTGQPTNRIRVLTGDIGGSFGQKGVLSREDVALTVASMRLGRPCKWVEDRSENLQAAGQARDESVEISAAVTSEGELLAIRANMTMDQGAYPSFGIPSSLFPTLVKLLMPGAYVLPNYEFSSTVVTTNKATYLAYRGPWETETFVRERLLDLIAAELGLDPVDVRRRNLLRAEDQPTKLITGPDLEGVTAAETFDRAVARVDYPAFRSEQAAARLDGRYLGIGFCTYLEPAPGPGSWGAASSFSIPPERAVVRVEADGFVTVITSQSPHGQGHETTLAQLAADELSVPYESVKVVVGDTNVTPFSLIGTGGSRAATVASGAVIGAASLVREQIKNVAAQMLEASPADIMLESGKVMVKGSPATAIPLGTIATMSYMAPAMAVPPGQAPGLQATFDFQSGRGGWVNATHCVVVEVDPNTGHVAIVRYIVVEDCGEIIHPAIVAGQIRGGIAQGIGGVLYERSAYDDDGNFLAGTFMDYLVPTAMEIPRVEIEHLESPALDAINFRGVGEGGNVGAPAALVNAIADALAPFGARVTEKYLPPTRVLELARIIPVTDET
jgi:aerobic carbon-monoxide dehydrogenase large subunit